MPPYLRFWHLGSRSCSVMRSSIEIPAHILVKIEVLREREAFVPKLQGIIKSWLVPPPTLPKRTASITWLAKRVMVLCLTKGEVSMVTRMLFDHKKSLGLATDDYIAAVTAETNTMDTLHAIRKAKIIVCTTILSSSMNIPDLNAIIVFKSTYTMADLVQAWGRVGRDGSLSKAILLWSKASHTSIFPSDAYDAEASSLAWTPPIFRLRNSLRPTFSPSGVLAFAEGKTCRRLQISNLFNEAAYSSAKDCQQTFEDSNIDYSVVYCDICLLDATNVHRSLLDDFEDEGDFDDPNEEPLSNPTTTVPETRPNQIEASELDDDDDVDFILRDEGPTPGDEGAKLGIAIFSQLHALLETHAQLGSTRLPCFMCKSKSCQGIRDETLGAACSNREIVSTYRHKFVCFGCGGEHSADLCNFRGKYEQPRVPKELKRCFTCYLPQQAVGAFSFHSGDSNLSGAQQTCKLRGKIIFGLLAAAISSRPDVIKDFLTTHATHINGEPPQFPLAANQNGKLFKVYWTWLWQVSRLREKVLNLDIWLLYLLERCYE